MPDFVECFLHIHEYGRTGVFPIFLLVWLSVLIGKVCHGYFYFS